MPYPELGVTALPPENFLNVALKYVHFSAFLARSQIQSSSLCSINVCVS